MALSLLATTTRALMFPQIILPSELRATDLTFGLIRLESHFLSKS